MNRILIPIALAFLVLVSCDRSRSSTGWDYMPGMYYSKAYESYTDNPNFEDGLTMREPVAGTIPRDMVPFPYEKTDEDRVAAGLEMVNPWELNQQALDRGKEAYDIFCLGCHGETGDGQGYLYTSGRYPYPPASLINERALGLKDGEIYHSITVGYGIMGAHGGMIRSEDRWKIVHYMRETLQKQTD
jgi:hypothetical protein